MDIEQFRAKPGDVQPPMRRRKVPRHKPGEWFIKGPIPGDWLVRASQISCRALRVGLVLWYLAGVHNTGEVKPTWQNWERFGLSPDAGRHGLRALEQAGLIKVERHSGRCPVVTIEDVT